MSAPQTDPEEQARRHPVPLIVMGLVCLLVLIGFIWWIGYEVDAPDPSPEVERAQGAAPEAIIDTPPDPAPLPTGQ